MKVIHDKFTLGIVAGILGTIPSLILNIISVQINLAKFYSFQLTGSIYLFPGLTGSFLGLVFGGLIWLAFGAFLGVIITYLLELTGQDYWWAKGVAASFIIMFEIGRAHV